MFLYLGALLWPIILLEICQGAHNCNPCDKVDLFLELVDEEGWIPFRVRYIYHIAGENDSFCLLGVRTVNLFCCCEIDDLRQLD